MLSRFFLLMMLFVVSSYAQESEKNSFDETNFVAQTKRAHPGGVDPFDTEGYSQTNNNSGQVEGYRSNQDCYEDTCCYVSFLKNHVEIGGNYTYLHLEPEGLDSVSGSLGGLQVSYEYQPLHRIYQGVTFLWRQGNLDGDGPSRSFFDIDTQARIGYTFGFYCDEWIVSAFTGLGYRHMGEGLSDVDLNYNTLYIPVGFVSSWEFMDSWHIGANFQWRPQAYPTVKIDPLDGARWITEYRLANFLVEIPISYTFCPENRFAIVLKPFFEFWEDGQTTAEILGLALGLPQNKYLFGGVMLNLRYSF